MASRAIRAIAATVFAISAVAVAGATPQQQSGTFALYNGTQQIVSRVTLVRPNVLDIVQYPRGSNAPLVRYVSSESEPIHVILVRDDFGAFEHVHPAPYGNGHYRVQVALASGHRYYAFVGSRPAGAQPQVFRFTLKAGAPPHHVATNLLAPTTQSLAGPYRIDLSSAQFPARKSATIDLRVFGRNGNVVAVLPYHGARAHTVFVNPSSLEYVHIDAHSDGGKRLVLRIPPLAQGTYRMWLQFRENGTTFTAPFTLAAQ